MKRSFRLRYFLPLVASLASLAASAHADIISATVYLNIPDAGNAGDSANFVSTLANATFSVGGSGINFQTNNSDATTIASFLNNPTFTNMHNGFNANTLTDNSELVITGTVFLNAGSNAFVVGHDDGVVLTIPGIGYADNQGGPTSLTTTSFNVSNPNAAGSYGFTLDYAECCGGPADLIFQVNNAPVGSTVTPEPSSLVLLGTGALAFAGAVRRRLAR